MDAHGVSVGTLFDSHVNESGYAEPPEGERWMAQVEGVLRTVEDITGPGAYNRSDGNPFTVGLGGNQQPRQVGAVAFNLITVLKP